MSAEASVASTGGRRRLLARSTLFFGARVGGAVSAFALHWILTRWLGAEEQGRYAAAFSWAALLTTFALLGMPRAAMRFLPQAYAHEEPAKIRGFVRFGLRLALGLGAAIAIVGMVLGPGDAMFWAFACVPAFAALRLGTGILHGASRFTLAALPNNVVRPVVVLAIAAVTWSADFDMDASTLMLAHGIVMLGIALALGLVVAKLVARLPESGIAIERRRWLGTSIPLMLVGLYTGMYADLNVALLSPLVGDAEVGVFFIAIRVAWLLAFGILAVDQATMPDISRAVAKSDTDALRAILRRATWLKFGVVCAGAGILAAFGATILGAFGDDDRYVDGYLPMLTLSAALVVRSAAGPCLQILGVSGHHRDAVRIAVIGIVVTILLHLALVPSYGLQGAALGILAATCVTSAWMRHLCLHQTGVDPSILMRHRRLSLDAD